MAYSDNTKQLEMLFGHTINTIVEGELFLSDMHAATNHDILKNFDITHVVNASNGIVENAFPDKYEYLNIDVEDDNEADITPHFEKVFDFLSSSASDGASRILFHCRLGVSRSATLLLAFMMKKYAMTLREAYDLAKGRRSKIQPSDTFTDALLRYESELFPQRESDISFKYITGYSSRPSSIHSKMSIKESFVEEASETNIAEDEMSKDKQSNDNTCCIVS